MAGGAAGALARTAPADRAGVHPLHRLQRTVGNQAVRRLVQARLQVGSPDDALEHEADRVARRVVGMSALDADAGADGALEVAGLAGLDAPASIAAGEDAERGLASSAGGGSPLPDHLLGFMEPRFGRGFADVRIHTDHEAAQLNQALGARAFTVAGDIYYGAGESPENLELTAHELTHVLQQAGGLPRARPA